MQAVRNKRAKSAVHLMGCRGVQSKPRRMFVMTVGCLVAATWPWWPDAWYALLVASWIILVGSVVTCVTRTLKIARLLRERAAAAGKT